MVRRRAAVLPWIRSAAYLVVALAAVSALPFYPAAARPLLALVCGALGLFAPAIGVLVLIVVLALPLAAGNFLVGAVFLLTGLAAVQYLGQDGSRAFVVVALAFVASAVRAEWAIAPLAGYLLGASEGAAASAVAVVLIELAGIALGHASAGTIVSGGGKPLVDATALAALRDPLAFGWLGSAIAKLNVDTVLQALRAVRYVPLLIVQPFLWAVAAALSGGVTKRDAPLRSVVAVAGVSLLLAAASIGALSVMRGPVAGSALGAAVPVSMVAATVVAALAAWVFPLVPAPEEPRLPSLRAEDAEVDELLRMISNAEEALEDRHATDRVVLITDMKSFARMTQERGTVATAKAIQRHRDLLLPVVGQCGGHGKSTGGDGLVAAFSSPDEALKAAVLMQRALKRYNERKSGNQQIMVRMGLAAGDVILDRAGCPFIGDALNLAARIMALADGGQIFAAAEVVDASADLPSPVVSHGGFTLKNIARAVNVFEVLWDEGQQPKRPETEAPAA